MDNQLQNKLTRFEALPPEGAWDKIVAKLAEEDSAAVRLYNYHETPTARNWEAIEKNLSAEAAPAKVVSFGTRFQRPIRYATAASVIGFVVLLSTLMMKRGEAGAIQTDSKLTVPTKQTMMPLPDGADTIGHYRDSLKKVQTSE